MVGIRVGMLNKIGVGGSYMSNSDTKTVLVDIDVDEWYPVYTHNITDEPSQYSVTVPIAVYNRWVRTP